MNSYVSNLSRVFRVSAMLVFSLLIGAACQTPQTTTTTDPDSGGVDDSSLGDRGESTSGPLTGADLETVYFDYDASSLSEKARQLLRHNAEVLEANSGKKLEIQGNCDERGTTEYNLALGKRRAEAAKRYIVDLGIPRSQISTVSFGEENPAVRGSTESAWARNRRDDFVLR